jgi:predicted Zn finger-like uncharacterized protein
VNVSCEKCGKAYVFPDAALAVGAKARVRCKKCQHIFEVSRGASTEGAPPPGATALEESIAELPASADGVQLEPGAITKFFIEQSGASRRNPAWKIVVFALCFVGLPVSLLYMLSSFQVVVLNVPRTTEQGEVVQEPFFSSNGVSTLADFLTGEEKKRREAAEALRIQAAAKAAAAQRAQAAAAEQRPRAVEAAPTTPPPGDLELMGAASPFAAGGDLHRDTGPRVRRGESAAPAIASAGGLDDATAAKVVAQSQPAFQGCIEEALRRTPSMRVGKVSVVVSVAKSGVVKSVGISPKEHENSLWGGCLIQRAKRMVFPPFEGDDEAELQVPLVVGVGM